RRDVQERVLSVMGIGAQEAQEKFGFLLDAFSYGAPPHGGIAFGWDRVVSLLAGEDSIREVIAFPKSGGGYDPLTQAPAPITPQQRKEAGVAAKPASREKGTGDTPAQQTSCDRTRSGACSPRVRRRAARVARPALRRPGRAWPLSAAATHRA